MNQLINVRVTDVSVNIRYIHIYILEYVSMFKYIYILDW